MKWLIFLALLAPSVALADPIPLLDDALQQLGGCYDPRRSPKLPEDDYFSQIPMGGFRRSWEEPRITRETFEKLRGERDAVIEEVRVRLEATAAVEEAGGKLDLRPILELYLGVVLDLNGIEALPELLSLEQQFDRVATYEPRPYYTLHLEILSVIAALLGNEGAAGLEQLKEPVYYGQNQRDVIIRAARRFLASATTHRAASAMRKVPEDW